MNFTDTWAASHLEEKEPWPTTDGPAVAIQWPENSPGWRSVLASEGTDSEKYLLEIAGNSSSVITQNKVYKYNIKTGAFTFLFSLSPLRKYIAFQVRLNINTIFLYDDIGPIYAINATTGVEIGSFNLKDVFGASCTIVGLCYSTLTWQYDKTDPTKLVVVFGFNSSANYTFIAWRKIICDGSTLTVGNGTYTQVSTNASSVNALNDPFPNVAPLLENEYLVNTCYYGGSYKSYIFVFDVVAETIKMFGVFSPGTYPGYSMLPMDESGVWGYNAISSRYLNTVVPNRNWGIGNLTVTSKLMLPSANTFGYAPTRRYVRSAGGSYNVFPTGQFDILFSKNVNISSSVLTTPLFRYTTFVSGMSAYAANGINLIALTNRGFFVQGQITNTTKVAPLIWYYVAE